MRIVFIALFFFLLSFHANAIDVHPDYELVDFMPEGFYTVTGMDFLSDGRLVVCTLDKILKKKMRYGKVYIIEETGPDTPKENFKIFADSLEDPLGLTIVNDSIYIMERNSLSLLLDHDKDDVMDQKDTIATGWNFPIEEHVFAFGPIYHEGYFYFNLSILIKQGGNYEPDKQENKFGCVLKAAKGQDHEIFACGFRNHNGLGLGPNGEIFTTDNQGTWLPSSTFNHVQKDKFYGHEHILFTEADYTPPTAWLPHRNVGRSPGQPILVTDGIFAGQMLFGETGIDAIQRVFLDKVNGEYQGCVIPFTSKVGGVNSLTWGKNGELYIGGFSKPGNWAKGEMLGKLVPKNPSGTTFEIFSVEVVQGGFVVTFTHPLEDEIDKADFNLTWWRYKRTKKYGGPKLDEESLPVVNISKMNDGKSVYIKTQALEPDRVIHLSMTDLQSASGDPVWAGEAWYTLNALSDRPPASVVHTLHKPGFQILQNPSSNHTGFFDIHGRFHQSPTSPGLYWPGMGYKSKGDQKAILVPGI